MAKPCSYTVCSPRCCSLLFLVQKTHVTDGGIDDTTGTWCAYYQGMLMGGLEARWHRGPRQGDLSTWHLAGRRGLEPRRLARGYGLADAQLASWRGHHYVFDGALTRCARATVADICISQRGFLNLLSFTAPGHGGHSSNPFGGTSLERLSCALAALSEAKPTELNDIVKKGLRNHRRTFASLV